MRLVHEVGTDDMKPWAVQIYLFRFLKMIKVSNTLISKRSEP